MKMKTTLTCMICCILILEATGRIERPRGVALSSKYSKCCGSFRVRSTNGLRVTPPISMKFGTLADNA